MSSLTPSHSHTHTRTPSHSQALAHTLTPSHSHTLTLSHLHTLTPSHSHNLTISCINLRSHALTLLYTYRHTFTPSHSWYRFTKEDAAVMDFSAYLASDSEESEDESKYKVGVVKLPPPIVCFLYRLYWRMVKGHQVNQKEKKRWWSHGNQVRSCDHGS